MVSPETFRRYPFFALLTPDQLAQVAMLTEENEFTDGATLFEQKDRAERLYFLLEGCVDLYYTVVESFLPADRREALVCQINPGEIFGISALIPPHEMTATARSAGRSRVMEINAGELAALCAQDAQLEILLLRRVAQAAMQRLHAAHIQLAAAWA
jgi:CRP-like cAMP-binding protein